VKVKVNREELVELRDAINTLLSWPDNVRDQIAAWLAPEAAKPGNGVDPHPAVAPTGKALKNGNLPDLDLPVSASETDGGSPRQAAPRPYAGKARRGRSPLSGKAAERKLLEAMRESPGLSVAALAKAVSAGRSTTGERLRQLAARGAIDKDADGRWRMAGEEPGPTLAPSS
jgi:hypothetical protein